MTKTSKKEIIDVPATIAANSPVVPTGISAEDLLADSGSGSENVTAQDMAIPIISILQANSPQCKRSDPKYIEGAHEGCLYNNVTESLEGDEEHGITVVPCFFEKVFIEWKPNRGGFVAIHPANTPLRDQIKMVKNSEGKDVPTLPSGNNLIETDQHYVLVLKRDGSFEAAVIAMSSSALRESKKWNTFVEQVTLRDANGKPFKPARFYGKYKITTKARAKDSYSWATWAIEPAGVNTTHYQEAKGFFSAVKGGSVRVKQEPLDDAPVSATTASKEDDIPLDI